MSDDYVILSTFETYDFLTVQLLGATSGAGILYGLVPDGKHGSMGVTGLHNDVLVGQGQ